MMMNKRVIVAVGMGRKASLRKLPPKTRRPRKPPRAQHLPKSIGHGIGIEMKERVQPFLVALMDRGVLAFPAGPTVLRLLPPLVISEDQIDTVAEAVREVLSAE